ncbi:ABC transporter substrate-binding protein [Azospirillum thermophilum]|uniref:Branched-chain amino acid ABC transporter substrate-binding protein n=1 Tax=Azospirillum thermophilum TaxID=2202148 RepID=A0A2S2CZC3_9PROT|nr:ABC transporter substrate-binding protein [Azospirillum thermophilum]AWK89839.1 branched-chain amino acid ABC transporter substrate-binding protein [Azospirillum thermophilum]
MQKNDKIARSALVGALMGSLVSITAGPALADITVGFVTAQSGPVSSLGIPYARGIQAAVAYMPEIAGQKVRVITLDDASDPSTASKNARKLVEEEKVDVLIGSAGSPSSLAMAAVARETKTPLISIANANLSGEDGAWMVTVPQEAPLMISAIAEHMKKNGVKTVGYIGFSDAWGDLVYNAMNQAGEKAGIKVLTNERYARADSSATAQALKVVAARPDVVLGGGSGAPGALAYRALAERGWKGPIYGTHALINPDFVRVGGAAVEGLIAPTGPVVVAEQLPDDNPMKKIGLAFREAMAKTSPGAPADAFAAYSFDAWLILADAAGRAIGKAQPGTPEFRVALHDAINSTRDLVGTHGVYSFTPDSRYGTDERSRVVVKLEKGNWKLLQ